MRLVGTSLDCYNYLEPLYNDYRKIRRKDKMGSKYVFFFFSSYGLELLFYIRAMVTAFAD